MSSVDLSHGYELQIDSVDDRLDATRKALGASLDFHGMDGSYGSHSWHPFPAKFPPQLPEYIIRRLSDPGDLVLDPMVGSGTTMVEAVRIGRRAAGCDIDPLARMITSAKLSPIDPFIALSEGKRVLSEAREDYYEAGARLQRNLKLRFDAKTESFIQFWFLPQQQLELLALVQRIEALPEGETREFLKIVFSSTIIAKSGGVSLARDLAHTRPHRDMDKKPNSAFSEFGKRLERNVGTLESIKLVGKAAHSRINGPTDARESVPFTSIHAASAENTGLPSGSVDLIVTSPPYANNAIDYMRAHKFALVWFHWTISDLAHIRSRYLGHDAISGLHCEELPDQCERTLEKLMDRDERKALVLRRYFQEMKAVICEMFRVLRRGKPAVIVVGSSNLRGIDVETHKGLAAIGENEGFVLAGIGTRQLDRDKRMMPARWGGQQQSQIEERMYKEYVLGLVKP